MPESEAVVAIVDDDPWALDGLQRLIRSAGWRAETFASAQEFLAVPAPRRQVSGLGPATARAERARPAEADGRGRAGDPPRFLTGHGDIPASVQAMKAGAVEFLTKPVDEQKLLQAIQEAIERDRGIRQRHATMLELQRRYESLTAASRKSCGRWFPAC